MALFKKIYYKHIKLQNYLVIYDLTLVFILTFIPYNYHLQYVCSSEGESNQDSRRRRNADVRPADGQTNPSVVRGFTLTAIAEGITTLVFRTIQN